MKKKLAIHSIVSFVVLATACYFVTKETFFSINSGILLTILYVICRLREPIIAKGSDGVIKEFYSWFVFERDLRKLTRQIKGAGKTFKKIYGVPRGGLLLAVRLSNSLRIETFVNDIREIDEETLVCDDISDNGTTIEKLFEKIKIKPFFVSIYIAENTSAMPDIYLRKKRLWIVFLPWEKEEMSQYDGTVE